MGTTRVNRSVLASLLLIPLAAGALALGACGRTSTAATGSAASLPSTPLAASPAQSAVPARAAPGVGAVSASSSPMGRPRPAFSYSSQPDSGYMRGFGRLTQGWAFRPTRDIEVTHLGYIDPKANGLVHRHRVGIFEVTRLGYIDLKANGLVHEIRAGIFDGQTYTLTASATVGPKSVLKGFFRWEPLREPVVLRAGHSYLTGGEYVDGDEIRGVVGDGGVWAPEVGHSDGDLVSSRGFAAPHEPGGWLGFMTSNFKFTPTSSATPLPAATGRGVIAFHKGTLSGSNNLIGSLGLHVVRADGTGLKRLAADGHHPAWSPDGSKIAYLDSEGVSIMNADGSGQRQVSKAQVRGDWGSGARVAWSPDGRQLVFNDYVGMGSTTPPKERTRSLFLVSTDGSGRRQLTTGQAGTSDEYPAWTPDGRIFFIRLGRGGYSLPPQLCCVSPDGTAMDALMTVAPPLGRFFSLSPDGRWLLMEKRDSGDRLIRLAADGQGKEVTLLANVGRYAEPRAFFGAAPSWSPDGRKIVVAADEGAWIAPAGLYILNADGSGLRRLPKAGLGWNPVWQP